MSPRVKDYIIEECFYCVKYGDLSFVEAYNMPVKWRRWWLNKVSEINEEENQKRKQPAMAPVHPQGRSLRARDVGR